MVIRSRAAQDRRGLSRVIARQECEFSFEGVRREAVVVDLSLKGAFLSSKFLPPKGGDVTLNLKVPLLKRTLMLDGKVIRGCWAMSDHGKLSRFGIRFSHASSDLIELINRLS